LLLYAVGIGAKKEDFPFVYELHKSFAPFPTYPVVLSLKGASQDVTDFSKGFAGEPIPGLPKFDPNRVVHGSMSIEVLKPLPLESGSGWSLKKSIAGVHENKSGIIVDMELLLVDPSGVPYTRMITSSFNLGAKSNPPQKFSKTTSSSPTAKPPPKGATPNYIVTETTSEEQAIIYRLSGDYNPTHIEPSVGKKMGFGGVILHGLATYGFAARAVLERLAGNDPNALKYFACRFTTPVKPGDTIETSIWEVGPGPDGTTEVSFVTKDLTSGKIVLGGGIAYVRKVEKSKL